MCVLDTFDPFYTGCTKKGRLVKWLGRRKEGMKPGSKGVVALHVKEGRI